jgi:hypothetical protein
LWEKFNPSRVSSFVMMTEKHASKVESGRDGRLFPVTTAAQGGQFPRPKSLESPIAQTARGSANYRKNCHMGLSSRARAAERSVLEGACEAGSGRRLKQSTALVDLKGFQSFPCTLKVSFQVRGGSWRSRVLWTIFVILLVLWLLGFSLHIGGGLIHLLIVIAVIVLIVNLVSGRNRI